MDYKMVIQLLVGLAAFLLGFKFMSDNLEKVAGNKLKALFNKTSDKKLVNVGMGAATTAVVQSSSITTVMVVGFVNAGIMTLYQATAIIMGANIGTTITAYIVALQSVSISTWFQLLVVVGVVLIMFTKKNKLISAGYLIAGLGLVFVGLSLMSKSMDSFAANDDLKYFLAGLDNPFALLFIGIGITAIIQSSSVVTSLVITMAASGLLIGEAGGLLSNAVLYIILGANIGTCVTAVISSIGANRNAKRASIIHLMFNVFGTVIFMIILLIWKDFMSTTLSAWLPGNYSLQIALFHTFFNVLCTLIFLPFSKHFVKLSQLIIPEKKDKKELAEKMTYMDKRFLRSPALAIGQLAKETYLMGDLAMKSLTLAYEGFKNRNTGAADKVTDNNDKIQSMSREIVDYLINISALDVSLSDEKLINALHNNVSDIVRVSELADNITKYTQRSVEGGLMFSDIVYKEVGELYDLLVKQYEMTKRIVLDREYSLLRETDRREDAIDKMRKNMLNEHIERLNSGECRPESNSVFISLISNMERIGDHISYMAHSMDNI